MVQLQNYNTCWNHISNHRLHIYHNWTWLILEMTINIFLITLKPHPTKSNNNRTRFNPITLFIVLTCKSSLSKHENVIWYCNHYNRHFECFWKWYHQIIFLHENITKDSMKRFLKSEKYLSLQIFFPHTDHLSFF